MCLAACFGYRGEREASRFNQQVRENVIPPRAVQTIPSRPKQSNGIRVALAQAPLPVSAVRVNGRYVCAKKNDKPGRSNKNKRGHIDRQCCLDPDEKPNPHCDYSYKGPR